MGPLNNRRLNEEIINNIILKYSDFILYYPITWISLILTTFHFMAIILFKYIFVRLTVSVLMYVLFRLYLPVLVLAILI